MMIHIAFVQVGKMGELMKPEQFGGWKQMSHVADRSAALQCPRGGICIGRNEPAISVAAGTVVAAACCPWCRPFAVRRMGGLHN